MSRFLARPLRLILEFLAAFLGILVVLAVLMIWRLSLSPMSSAFFTPYIETAIVNLMPGTKVSILHTLLVWDNQDHSITLHADGIHLTSTEDDQIADVPALDIRVSALGLLTGRLVPAGLRIGEPHLWLTRDKDGNILFGGMTPKGGHGGSLKASLQRVAEQFTRSHLTRKLEVVQAKFDIHDEMAGDWTLTIPEALLEHRLGSGIFGEAKIEAKQGKNTALAVVHYNYESAKKLHDVVVRFSGINPKQYAGEGSQLAAADLPLTGEVSFVFDNAFDFAGGAADIHGNSGVLNYSNFWDAPRAVKSVDIKGRYDRKSGLLSVPAAEIDFGGPKLTLSLSGAPPVNQTTPPHDLDLELNAKLVSLPMNDFAKVWPKPIIPGARDWISRSLSKGMFDKGEASFKGSLSWSDIGNVAMTEGQGKVSAVNGTVKYMDGMPPVSDVSASATFDLNKMSVVISGGGIGDLQLQQSTILMTDFEQHVQNIDLPLHVVGPVSQVLKLIDSPPLGYAKSVGLDPDSVGGKFDGTVELKFPLLNSLPMKDIDAKAKANITGLASEKLLPGYTIGDGNLTFDLDKIGFTLQGDASLNSVPLQVSWKQAFEEKANQSLQQVSVTGNVSGDQWSKLGIDMLAKSQGPIAVNFAMVQKTKKLTTYSGSLDMNAAALQIDDLAWKKAAGESSAVNFSAEQPEGKNIIVKSIEAHGPGLKIAGKGELTPGWNPVSVTLDPFIAGRSNAKVGFTQEPGPYGKMSFDVEGNTFDVSGLNGGKDEKSKNPRPQEFRLKLNKLFTSEEGVITNVQGSAVRDQQGWSAISLHGLADGGHPLDFDLTPQPDGLRTLLLTCDDFGKALKGLGFTDTVREGKLKIKGASTVEKPREIEGKVFIGHFEVKDLPALVVLMNATSPFGIVNLFNGSLSFDHLEGDFRWQQDTLDLKDVKTSGTSVGMTIDGKIDMNSGNSDLHGTMAPFSVFNRIIGAIPLIGDMVTGGEGQGVIGVTYAIKGPLDKPQVSVNPASLLTPGFLRNLFFGGGSSDEDSDNGVAAPKQPAPAPAAKQQLPPAQTNIIR